MNVRDVAMYVVERAGPVDKMRLQKLLYYCQAWSIAWDGQPLFEAPLEGWTNGPVCREVWQLYRPGDPARSLAADPEALDDEARRTIDAVLLFYTQRSSNWLSELTHREPPWRESRRGLGPADRGDAEISLDSMRDYYSGFGLRQKEIPRRLLAAFDVLVETPEDVIGGADEHFVQSDQFEAWLDGRSADPWDESRG